MVHHTVAPEVSPAFRYFDLKTGASNHNLDFYKEDVNETAENK